VKRILCADYFLEDIVQMLDFTPPPSDRKRKGGREDDDGAPPPTEGDEDTEIKEVYLYSLFRIHLHAFCVIVS